MIRITSERSIPLHFEAVPLRGGVRLLGWASALVEIGSGLLVALLVRGWVAETIAPLLAVLGGLSLVGVVRCRRCEVTLGTTRIDLAAGPFKRVAPSGAVESAARRPATSWRRLYADEEVVLRLGVGTRDLAIPSRKPGEIEAVLRPEGHRARSETW